MPNRGGGPAEPDVGEVRIDKWLWAARLFRTRSLAQAALVAGRVLVAGERVKVARGVHVGELLRIRTGSGAAGVERTLRVLALSQLRGPAPVAQALYEETAESVRARVAEVARRALHREPAEAIEGGRPTKRDRRRIERMREDGQGG
ncbi:MAG: RNA-binding S4 domain-containing protein [Burkholderiaceae bacterium]|nr:RNA-binding S4 domain-containing protein [Burkholderiaceae bacterium]